MTNSSELSAEDKKRIEEGLRPHIQHAYDRGFEEGRATALRLVSEKFKDYEEFEDLSIKEIRSTLHSLQEEGK